jgi:hypothetical protein
MGQHPKLKNTIVQSMHYFSEEEWLFQHIEKGSKQSLHVDMYTFLLMWIVPPNLHRNT